MNYSVIDRGRAAMTRAVAITAISVAFCSTAISPATATPNAPLASPAVEGALTRDLSKDFKDLTPSERIAIRAAAKAAYQHKRLHDLVVCADPGNMPFSNDNREGFENKIAEVLGKATGARVSFYWRPSSERGMTRQTFSTRMCDAMIDIPTGYSSLLTTNPIYRTTYVLAYRSDKGLHIKSFDDPELKKLRIGVFQTSGIRQVLLRHGIFDNVSVHTVSHDADINLKDQPWYQVQQVVDGKLDVAAVWGPFAGWVKAKQHEPITIQPVNLWEDTEPLEFDLAIGVRKTDAMLKYILDYALEDHKAEIEQILKDYGVPLVNCSRCLVQGDLPAHGSYTKPVQTARNAAPGPGKEAARLAALEQRLAGCADPTQELSEAVIANDPERVTYLVKHGTDINKRDGQGYTPLTSAARQRYAQLIKVLLDLKADPNATDADKMTPLLEAVIRNDVPSIKVLLANGADKESAGPQGYNALSLAIEEREYEAAKALIDAGAKVNARVGPDQLTPLMVAAAEMAPPEGAVFLPSSTRPLDIAKALIQRGADVNAQAKNGVTALMVAAGHNNAPMIGLLMQSGANPKLKDRLGEAALDFAKRNGNVEAAQAIEVLSKTISATETHPPAGKGQGPKG
jgi:quinoprotein dehydrogenase-associated probable ABC transporter substrate-binding protein